MHKTLPRPTSINCFVLLWLLCATILFGQVTTSLRGTVTDSQGAVVSDAIVTLADPGTGFTRNATSTASGEYQFSQVPPGTYSVTVKKPGFAVSVNHDVKLEVNTPATLDCHIDLGSVATTVEVQETVSAVNTVDGSVGNPFQEKQIKDLPLQTRNVVELLSIQPGVTQTGEVLGARRDQNNITLDGVDVNNNQNSGIAVAQTNGSASVGKPGSAGNTPGFNAAIPVPLDSVEEFRVTVAGQGAEEGRSSGGQVTLITKSGTNTVHGTLYEYNRNTLLAANDFFNNENGVPRAALVRNQFGVSLGGPIIKDRVFLFGNWERRIDASSQPQTVTVPSQALRNGNLTVALSDGSTAVLNQADVAAIDPLHIGYSAAMKQYLNGFPIGNAPSLSIDNGLNFNGLRFNTPLDLDQSAYVAKLDINIDQARKHTLSVRGTLNSGATDTVGAQFPGQSPTQLLLDNSRGLSANYTYVIRPDMVNALTFGITRLGLNNSGTEGTALSFTGVSSIQNYSSIYRPSIQIMPTYNIADNFTWTRSKHTITTGLNFRYIRNTHTSYANSYPSYSFSHNTLGGLGGDANTLITNYVNQKLGTTDITLKDPTAAEDGLGNLLGLINEYTATYQFTKTGSVIPFGTPATREYAVNDYEGYVQDSWRIRRDLTITAGLRYSNPTVPWEVHGTEVVTTVPLQKYFAERVGAMLSGTPSYAIPDASLTYTLGGAANGKPGWYQRNNLDFAPRFSFAYAPDGNDHWWSKFLGKGSVFRGGFALVYDQYGSDMVYNIDQSGSPGLASTVTQPVNTDFTTSSRYNGPSSLPALPAAPSGGFPFTPATITGGFNEGVGVVSNLKAPYSMVLNANYAKQLPGKMTIELGYAGRLYRRGLLEQDFDQPLTQFRDPVSGMTWSQAAQILHADYLAAGQTYGPIANIPFIENIFPALANAKGSATQNYYNGWVNTNGLSDEDNLNLSDRQRIKGTNTCYTKTGCNTFYPLQFAGLPTWTNNAFANYHAATVTLRRPLTSGFAYDFNYTWSHSIDNSSGAESGAGTGGAVLQDAFNTHSFRGPSDFDMRHNITADITFELPFGNGKRFAGSANKYADAVIGGWQVSTIARYHSGLPTTIGAGGVYPTNYEYNAITNLLPGAPNNYGQFIDNNGLPSVFSNTSASNNYFQQPGGTTGTRGIVRLPGFTNFDVAIMKNFKMPFEGHLLQFRGEAFNVANHVNFYNPSLDVNTPATFGEFQSAYPARVFQASLRYAF